MDGVPFSLSWACSKAPMKGADKVVVRNTVRVRYPRGDMRGARVVTLASMSCSACVLPSSLA